MLLKLGMLFEKILTKQEQKDIKIVQLYTCKISSIVMKMKNSHC